MAMDSRHEDVECSSSCSRNCIDAIERHSIGMGVHKAKKFFSLQGKAANLGQRGEKVDSQTYSDLVYEALYRPQCDVDDQNSYGRDYRHGADWKRTPGSQ